MAFETAYQVRRGMTRKVRVDYDAAGRSSVTPLEDWRLINSKDRLRWAESLRRLKAATPKDK